MIISLNNCSLFYSIILITFTQPYSSLSTSNFLNYFSFTYLCQILINFPTLHRNWINVIYCYDLLSNPPIELLKFSSIVLQIHISNSIISHFSLGLYSLCHWNNYYSISFRVLYFLKSLKFLYSLPACKFSPFSQFLHIFSWKFLLFKNFNH